MRRAPRQLTTSGSELPDRVASTSTRELEPPHTSAQLRASWDKNQHLSWTAMLPISQFDSACHRSHLANRASAVSFASAKVDVMSNSVANRAIASGSVADQREGECLPRGDVLPQRLFVADAMHPHA